MQVKLISSRLIHWFVFWLKIDSEKVGLVLIYEVTFDVYGLPSLPLRSDTLKIQIAAKFAAIRGIAIG